MYLFDELHVEVPGGVHEPHGNLIFKPLNLAFISLLVAVLVKPFYILKELLDLPFNRS